jgi:hypothetical protein
LLVWLAILRKAFEVYQRNAEPVKRLGHNILETTHWGEKLRQFLEARMPNTSWSKRAHRLGISTQNMSNWINKKTDAVPPELVSKLLDAYPQFDVNYLFREGWPAELEMEKPTPEAREQATPYRFNPENPAGSVKHDQVPTGKEVRCPGYALGPPGNEQLIIDFLVIPASERANLPIGVPLSNVNQET